MTTFVSPFSFFESQPTCGLIIFNLPLSYFSLQFVLFNIRNKQSCCVNFSSQFFCFLIILILFFLFLFLCSFSTQVGQLFLTALFRFTLSFTASTVTFFSTKFLPLHCQSLLLSLLHIHLHHLSFHVFFILSEHMSCISSVGY